MCLTCKYCGRIVDPQEPRVFDPHGCFGCTTRLPNLSICQICREPLPITADGRRTILRYAPLCDVCGAPKLPSQNTVTDDAPHTHIY